VHNIDTVTTKKQENIHPTKKPSLPASNKEITANPRGSPTSTKPPPATSHHSLWPENKGVIHTCLTIEKEPRACRPRAGEIEQQGHQLETAGSVDDSKYRWKTSIMKVPIEYYRSSPQRNTTVEARLEIHRRHDGEWPILQTQRCMKAFQSEKEKNKKRKHKLHNP